MSMLRSARLAPVLAALLVGCAPGVAVKSHAVAPWNPRRVLGDELVATLQPDLYSAIATCRPMFFRPRDPRVWAPVLYVDGLAKRDFDAIRDIPLDHVATVEFMSGADATWRYGTGHPDGAILVWTKVGRVPG